MASEVQRYLTGPGYKKDAYAIPALRDHTCRTAATALAATGRRPDEIPLWSCDGVPKQTPRGTNKIQRDDHHSDGTESQTNKIIQRDDGHRDNAAPQQAPYAAKTKI